MKAVVTRQSEHHFKFSIRGMSGDIDVQADPAAEVYGPSPKELLLAALCGCTGTDVVDLLKKFGVSYSAFHLEAKAGLTQNHPKIFDKINLQYFLEGDNIDDKKLMDAVTRSTHQYSGTAAMLSKACPIAYSVYLNNTLVAEGDVSFNK